MPISARIPLLSAAVNEQGCELDDDVDGVKNSADQCPDTVAEAKVNEQGCELDDDAGWRLATALTSARQPS
ncbi:MAG: hypothetical protein R3E95_20020 [Thiolinea sp.]